MATYSSILAWEVPWTSETGGPGPLGHKELDMTEATWHTHIVFYQAVGFWSILLISDSIY